MQRNIQNHFNITLLDIHGTATRFLNPLSSPLSSEVPYKKQSTVRDSSPILSDNEPDTEIERYFNYLIDKFEN